MKKILLSFIIFAFTLLILPDGSVAKAEFLSKFTVLLKDGHQKQFIEEVEKHSLAVSYEIKELDLYQIEGKEKDIINYLKSTDVIDSYNKSTFYTPEKSYLDVKDTVIKNRILNNDSPSTLWPHQWDINKTTNNGRSFEISEGSKNVVVGIVDSGIDVDHPDIKNNIVEGSINLVPQDGFNGDEPNETGDINEVNDKTGHGTFVAGQIAANGKLKGVAPQVGIKSYRVIGSNKSESIWIIKGIIEAAKDQVDVLNISLGEYLVQGTIKHKDGSITSNKAEIKAYKKAINFAKKNGTIVVASSGNDSLNLDNKKEVQDYWYKNLSEGAVGFTGKLLALPAALPGVVTVSSVGPSGELSLYSNYGMSTINISAYGGDFRLLEKYGPDSWISENWFRNEVILGLAPNGGYTYSLGTSLAAPKVSAALALVIDYKEFKNPNQTINYLYKNGTIQGDRKQVGQGILNVYNLLRN
ncbi:S8 family peptidase [Cytobacillus sp. FSL K6-0265]|uniref:S8 family peptidase n=1 Tax=Cytobacillus sp. FSL K6-0265 TaxID=2921448 RepID=UPI0030F7230B